MGSTDKIKEKKDKSDKKDKKEKKILSEEAGVKKDKKESKKEKKEKTEKLAKAVEAHLEKEGSVDPEDVVKTAEELVPFALPLADDKTHKKIYKLIKKGAKLKSIHRGVKECEKAIKKCPLRTAASPPADAPGLVIIAGDISPMDVIMHFPILCEEHGVPYLYIRSRADLGVAACTKRATSVVMLKPEGKKSSGKDAKKDEDGKVDPAEYLEAYKELVKTAQKQWNVQVEPWVKGTHPQQIEARSKGSA